MTIKNPANRADHDIGGRQPEALALHRNGSGIGEGASATALLISLTLLLGSRSLPFRYATTAGDTPITALLRAQRTRAVGAPSAGDRTVRMFPPR